MILVFDISSTKVMATKALFFVAVLVLAKGTTGSECEAFRNSKARAYTGSKFDPLAVSVKEATSAYQIVVQNEQINTLCQEVLKNYVDLDTLTISDSRLRLLEKGAFRGATRLRILSLSGNQISAIPAGVFSNLFVRRLNFSENLIAEIAPDAFVNNLELQVLSLASNRLKTLNPEWFSSTPKLRSVDFSNNKLTKLPEDMFMGALVKDVSFSSNSINEIDANAFYDNADLDNLRLDKNQLKQFPMEFFKKLRINKLDLRSNKMECIDSQALASLSVEELNTEGNPLTCTCAAAVSKWAMGKGIRAKIIREDAQCWRSIQEFLERAGHLLHVRIDGLGKQLKVYIDNITEKNKVD